MVRAPNRITLCRVGLQHAQPGSLWQILLQEMHELPQGQPFLQYLQQAFERVDAFDALVRVCSCCATATVPKSIRPIPDSSRNSLIMSCLPFPRVQPSEGVVHGIDNRQVQVEKSDGYNEDNHTQN